MLQPEVRRAHEQLEQFRAISEALDAGEPERKAQRSEAKLLKERGDASAKANNFGARIEAAMRDRRAIQ